MTINYSRHFNKINLNRFVILLNPALLIYSIIDCRQDELIDLDVTDINTSYTTESTSSLTFSYPGFITTWSGQTITIPTDPGLTYNYSVDWNNDGTNDETGITGDITHTFETGGNHTIQITGTFPAIRFGKLPKEEAEKIISIDQWGKNEWHSTQLAFAGCSNLQVRATDIPDFSKVTSMFGMFRGASLANPDVSNWDTRNVEQCQSMFRNTDEANPDFSNWDISKWKNFSGSQTNIFAESGLTQENYEKALIRFAAHESDPTLNLPNDINLGLIPVTICNPEAQAAKALLLSKGWEIHDQGLDPQCQPGPSAFSELPEKLSELNLYENENLGDLTPSPAVFQYELNTALFTDHAKKQRIIAIPAGEQMISNGDKLPHFPDNTIISKTFYYNFDNRNPSLGRKIIETRVLVKQNGEWVTGNYLWNNAQTEAFLTEERSNTDVSFIDSDGNNINIGYVVPSKDDCFTCHQTNSNATPIGPKLRNMNLVANGRNQLQSLIDRQWLSGIFHPDEISILPNLTDPNESVENRARAYFEVNCAHCHTDGGLMQSLDIRLDFDTQLVETGIKSKGEIIEIFMANRFMPIIGTTVVDEEGLELIKAYIERLN